MSDELAFSGLKVLDFSQGVAGPHCGMLLAQHGATVTKLEPVDGDWGRRIGRQYGDNCAYGAAFNRGKRSLALNLKDADGLDIAKRLAKDADVILENYRPGVLKKFGLDYESVIAENPTVVFLSITGFGQTGPKSSLPATDSVMQAFSGLMSVNKESNGMPMRVGMLAIDVSTGLYAFQAVAPAIYRRAMQGKGTHITTSLMESIGAFQAAKMIEYVLEGTEVQSPGVPVGTFQAKDGFININGRRDSHFEALCNFIGKPEWAADTRFATVEARFENEAKLMPLLREIVADYTVADLNKALNEADVLNGPVNEYGHYFEDVHVKEVRAISWIEQSGLGSIPIPSLPGHPALRPGEARGHTPHLGEHSREVLHELGFGNGEIDRLRDRGAVTVLERAEAAE
ncbi:MAG: CoA transferase [Pseudomonadota bacterium]|nr:CoA transferase [Pseudomonadota bacterium]